MSAELVLASVPQQTRSSKRVYVATPFQICKGINQILDLHGFKPIPPQMLYRYRSQGKFQCTVSDDGRYEVDRESFEIWFGSYLAKKIRLSH